LGVGFKARNESDKQVDAFYEDYYKLIGATHDKLISPEQSRQKWDALREQYPFMDTLLLSRKAGLDGERAYAWNVLNRIPPGQSGDLLRLAGIDQGISDKFYANGGDLSFMSETERDTFKAAMVNIGAMLAVPDYATRQEWSKAKTAYSNMNNELVKAFGYDIQDKIQNYFEQDPEKRDAYLSIHPEVQQALQYQDAAKLTDPNLRKYYGGIEVIRRYAWAQMYNKLTEKYGPDILKEADTYTTLKDLLLDKDAKAYIKAHPELGKYYGDKAKMTPDVLQNIAKWGAMIPEQGIATSTGNTPVGSTQQGIQDYLNPEPQVTIQDYQQMLGPNMSNLLTAHFAENKALPAAVTKTLDYQARNFGFQSGNDLLQAYGISYYRSLNGQ
jgi:hypothetical protein